MHVCMYTDFKAGAKVSSEGAGMKIVWHHGTKTW